MPQHLILRGDGAGKYLPFARNRLKTFRRSVSAHAFQNTIRARNATIRIQWAGPEKHIRIIAVSGRIVIDGATARAFAQSPLHPLVQQQLYFPEFRDTAQDVTEGPFYLGGHQTVFLISNLRMGEPEKYDVQVWLSKNDYGKTAELKHTYIGVLSAGNGFYANKSARFEYAGLVRDAEGKVIETAGN